MLTRRFRDGQHAARIPIMLARWLQVDWYWIVNTCGYACLLKRFAEAVPPLETAVKLEPRNPAAHYNLAMAYNRAGRKEDADKEFAVHRQMTEKAGPKPDAPPGAPPENSN